MKNWASIRPKCPDCGSPVDWVTLVWLFLLIPALAALIVAGRDITIGHNCRQ